MRSLNSAPFKGNDDPLKGIPCFYGADTEKLRQETAARFNELNRREKQLKEELEKLQAGSKAYPKYLEEAREYLKRRCLRKQEKAQMYSCWLTFWK